MPNVEPRARIGFTIVELFVVIAIISLLLQLLLPAVMSAREVARQTACRNNVRQIAAGILAHEAAHGHFPAGGWSWRWCGDPDRGFGRAQPGGWIYNTLPYLEQSKLRALGRRSGDAQKRHALAKLQATAVSVFACPSRRSAKPFPNVRSEPIRNADRAISHGRTDYAGNGGDVYVNLGAGPKSYQEADSKGFSWTKGNNIKLASGVFFSRSVTAPRHVRDGLSKTYLVGEKYLNRRNYVNGEDAGDDSSMFQGDDMDITRWASSTVDDEFWEIEGISNLPRRDDRFFGSGYCFGSIHASGWNVSLCDGSARQMSFDLDPEVHRSFGNREDVVVLGWK